MSGAYIRMCWAWARCEEHRVKVLMVGLEKLHEARTINHQISLAIPAGSGLLLQVFVRRRWMIYSSRLLVVGRRSHLDGVMWMEGEVPLRP